MSESFDLIAELRDQMSGPAKAINSALDGVKAALKGNEAAAAGARAKSDALAASVLNLKKNYDTLKSLGASAAVLDSLKLKMDGETKAAKLLNETTKALTAQKKQLQTQEKSLGVDLKSSGGFLASLASEFIGVINPVQLAATAIKVFVGVVVAAGLAVVGLVAAGTKFAIDAASFKNDMVFAYNAIRGVDGASIFKSVDRLAAQFHRPAEEVHNLAQSLIRAGLQEQKSVEGAVAAITALKRVGNDVAADKIKEIINTSLSGGKFVIDPKQLQGAGIAISDVYLQLASSLGKSEKQVKKLLDQGRIDAQVGIKALTDAINNSPTADLAKKFKLSDFVDDFKGSLKRLVQDVNIKPLEDAFYNFLGIFDQGTASGQTLKDGLTGAFDAIIRVVARAVDQVTIWSLEAEIAFLNVKDKAGPIVELFDRLSNSAGGLDQAGGAAERMGGGLLVAATNAAALINSLIRLNDLSKQSAQAGAEFVRGLVDGIKSGAAEAIKAVTELGHDMIGAVRKAFDSHSPSRVMFQEGINATEGIAMGADAGKGRAQRALEGAIQPPTITPGGNGGGAQIHIELGDMHFHGIKDAEEIQPIVEAMLADVADRLALELGQ